MRARCAPDRFGATLLRVGLRGTLGLNRFMVYLALNRNSALSILAVAVRGMDDVWVGSDAITEGEYQRFGSEGVELSRFIYPLTGESDEVIQDALSTVEEHHPGEIIWVQHVPKP